MILIGKTLNQAGEPITVYECEVCQAWRSTNKETMEEHEKKCYHEEEASVDNL